VHLYLGADLDEGLKTWTYSVSAPGGDSYNRPCSDLYVEEFLYNLENEPHERDNLVRDPGYAEVRTMLRERLMHRMAAAGEEISTIVPAELGTSS
jgi:hypothetical protein